MEIIEGKFYRTRDGRKVGPMRRQSNGWVADSGRIDDNGAYDWYLYGNYDCCNQETPVDLIAEWRDEPKSPIQEEVIQIITKRKLVAGTYSNVGVSYSVDAGWEFSLELNNYNAQELEEASHILAQLAEFLREEGK